MTKRIARRFICVFTVLTLIVSSLSICAFADVASPTKGKAIIKKKTASYIVEGKTVSMGKVHKNKKMLTYDGVIRDPDTNKLYKVSFIGKKAFSDCSKLRVLKIKWKQNVKVDKRAFSGLSKKQLKMIKVRVTRKMSKKNYKKLRKQLIRAGIKKGNICRMSKTRRQHR